MAVAKMVDGDIVNNPHYPPAKADIDQGLATPDGKAIRSSCRYR